LHDFFLSGLWEYCELAGIDSHAWSDALHFSHGYGPMQERLITQQTNHVRNTYPANLEVLELATNVIVHSEHAKHMAMRWYGPHAADSWHCIPLLRTPPSQIDRTHAREILGIDPRAFVVCSFGFAAPTKRSQELLDAWFASSLSTDEHCQLILVGQNHGGAYGKNLKQTITQNAFGAKVSITGWVDKLHYELYLQAADVGVQLRCDSRGETSAAVLDCLNFGLPTIINRHGSMSEIDSQAAYTLNDEFTQAQLAQALEALHRNDAERTRLHQNALNAMRYAHDPRACAAQYAAVIEANFKALHPHAESSSAWIRNLPLIKGDREVIMPDSAKEHYSKEHQLLVDVSEIARSDLRSGIERVVRAQLAQLMAHPPAGFRVEPIYLGEYLGNPTYYYARNYVTQLLGLPLPLRPELPVRVQGGDIFYGADFCPLDVIKATSAGIYVAWRQMGVKLSFVIYDLLPILHPQFFPPTVDERHTAWLNCIAQNADQVIAISQTVAKDVRVYIESHREGVDRAIRIDYVHQGADIDASFPTEGYPQDALNSLEKIASKPTFLMVGTIEPRKGILQAIAAFEQLWAKGIETQLLLVGKEGWVGLQPEQRRSLPQIMKTLEHHPEIGKRLLWFPDISDQYLQKIYRTVACLLMVSEAEGFGLPLIEAAANHCPVIARDIPVFREVAGDYAQYFSGTQAENLSTVIELWLTKQAHEGQLPLPTMNYSTWQENVAQTWQLLQIDP